MNIYQVTLEISVHANNPEHAVEIFKREVIGEINEYRTKNLTSFSNEVERVES